MPNDLTLATPVPATAVIVKAELLNEIAAIREAMGNAPAVVDQASMDAVRAVMVRAKGLQNTIDAQRSAAKAPFLAVEKAIDKAAKGVAAQLQEVIDEAKIQIEDFLRERDRQIREQERARAAAEAAARATHAALTAAAPAQARPTAPLVVVQPVEAIEAPTQTFTELVVTDISQVPREFFDLNMARLREAVITQGRVIPGTSTQKTTRVVAR